MTKFNDSVSVILTLNKIMAEEASRYGRHNVDLEDLLLALTLSHTKAGDVLRSQGVTWKSVTAAINALTSQRLASVGVTADSKPQPVNYVAVDGITPQVDAVFSKAKNSGADYLELADVLVAEPSGTIEKILDQIGVNADLVRSYLQAAVAVGSQHCLPDQQDKSQAENRVSAVIPVSMNHLDAFLADPQNLSLWEPSLFGRLVTPHPQGTGWLAEPNPHRRTQMYANVVFSIQRSIEDKLTWIISKAAVNNESTMIITFDTLDSSAETTLLTAGVRVLYPAEGNFWLTIMRRLKLKLVRKLYVNTIVGNISKVVRNQHFDE